MPSIYSIYFIVFFIELPITESIFIIILSELVSYISMNFFKLSLAKKNENIKSAIKNKTTKYLNFKSIFNILLKGFFIALNNFSLSKSSGFFIFLNNFIFDFLLVLCCKLLGSRNTA